LAEIPMDRIVNFMNRSELHAWAGGVRETLVKEG
jgi:hypothetical protein